MWDQGQIFFFGKMGSTLAGLYILMRMIHNRKRENDDAEKRGYCQSIPLPG